MLCTTGTAEPLIKRAEMGCSRLADHDRLSLTHAAAFFGRLLLEDAIEAAAGGVRCAAGEGDGVGVGGAIEAEVQSRWQNQWLVCDVVAGHRELPHRARVRIETGQARDRAREVRVQQALQ